MAKSIRKNRKNKAEKPRKPYVEFPLYAHLTRRWAKKIRGRTIFFGPWADPQGALAKYLEQKDALHAGLTPRVKNEGGLGLADLCNRFLTSKEKLLKSGEIVAITFKDYHRVCAGLIKTFGKDRLVIDLAMEDFEKLRSQFAETWGPVRLGNEIQRVRTVLNYAFANGLISTPIRYGQGFKRPSKKTMRLERKKGPRLFQPEEIHRMLGTATVPLRAMILMGINCGFGNSDCSHLPQSRLHLDQNFHNYGRPKTGIERKCFLWPETSEALRRVLAARPKPASKEHDDLVFITATGRSWSKESGDNPISKETSKLLKKLGIDGARNFYCLRHVFETIGGASRDQIAVDHIMGHSRNDMASVYREAIDDDRLRAVTDHIHLWLFGDGAAKA